MNQKDDILETLKQIRQLVDDRISKLQKEQEPSEGAVNYDPDAYLSACVMTSENAEVMTKAERVSADRPTLPYAPNVVDLFMAEDGECGESDEEEG
ncbi:MAG: hypothetical protein IJX94_06370 [Clostridia bacterium]|nr:hypothetical protein [Clostridia bacterium]